MMSLAEAERVLHKWPPTRLYVVYDDKCELCRRCRHWLSGQPTHVELAFLACSDPVVAERYGHLWWLGQELMVVDEMGRAWVGPQAFIMCLWATRRWRVTSYRLRGHAFAPMVERFFHTLSANRSVVSGMLQSHRCDDGSCRAPAPTAGVSNPGFARGRH